MSRKANNDGAIRITLGERTFEFRREPVSFRNIGQLNEALERLGSELARIAEPLALVEQELAASKAALESFWELKSLEAEGGNETVRKGWIRNNYRKELDALEQRRMAAVYNHAAIKQWARMLETDHSGVQTMSRNNERQRTSAR